MRLLACLIVAPQRGYDEPAILSYAISSFCPTSADGLHYALSKDLVRAEATLRRAAAQSRVDPRVRQSLALVVSLQGRLAEAEGVARADRPPDQGAGDVAYLRQTLALQNGWQQPIQPENPAVSSEGS